ncbi:MAG: protein kinase [Clostridia bacterium]
MVYINGRIGSMSYNLVDYSSEDNYTNLLEGIVFIENQYPYYDKDKLEDTYSNSKYSIQMIQNSLNGILEMDKFYKIVIFDILIGNSDRHHSNWAILAKGTVYKTPEDMLDIFFNYNMCPLYDNGSSLCAYEDNNNLEIFFKDKMKFEALVNTKSKSAIGWENERPIRHFELLKKIKDNAYELTVQYIEKIKTNINEENIDKILNEFDNNIISIDMKKLLKMYLLERRKRMLEIYDLKDEV